MTEATAKADKKDLAGAFGQKAKARLFYVNLAPTPALRRDFTAATSRTMQSIKELAAGNGAENSITIRSGGAALDKIGVFYLNAPEHFAQQVRGLDGVISVEKPALRPNRRSVSRLSRYR
ncbi:MAG: hypothetical protein OXT65_08265 [Alphaproteobacteria bacterium]|nr:hypothetical protein [Alphaproteobacteria bacterium]